MIHRLLFVAALVSPAQSAQDITSSECYELFAPDYIETVKTGTHCPGNGYLDPALHALCLQMLRGATEEARDAYDEVVATQKAEWSAWQTFFEGAFADCQGDPICEAEILAWMCQERMGIQSAVTIAWDVLWAETSAARISYVFCIEQSCRQMEDQCPNLDWPEIPLSPVMVVALSKPDCPDGTEITWACFNDARNAFGMERYQNHIDKYTLEWNQAVITYQLEAGAIFVHGTTVDCQHKHARVQILYAKLMQKHADIKKRSAAAAQTLYQLWKAFVIDFCCEDN